MLQVSPWSARECGLGGRLHGRTCGRRSHRCTFYRRESTDACSCYSCRRTPVRTHRNTLQWSRWTMKWCHEPTRADGLPCCKWDRVTAPSCTWSLLLHWPPAPLSSCALVLCVWILGLVYRRASGPTEEIHLNGAKMHQAAQLWLGYLCVCVGDVKVESFSVLWNRLHSEIQYDYH